MDIGILGSGQLGWMMILEGRKLGHRYYVLADDAGPAGRVADGTLPVREYAKFVDRCDVVTPEFEHIDVRVLEYAHQQGKLRPPLHSIVLKSDRSLEKEFLRDHGFPSPEFRVARDGAEAVEFAQRMGRAVIKAVRGGYDGKGQTYVGVGPPRGGALPDGPGYVVEEYVDFDTEASLIASRDAEGNQRFHLPSRNQNLEGILLHSEAPCADEGMTQIASRLLDALEYVGVMAVEFFLVNGKPLINEFAPRVHNSGHHTLHGSSISQFEQHLRVITGLPVPEPVLYRPSGIVNAVGVEPDRAMIERLLRVPETRPYTYGKTGLRKRRKMGHVNVTAPTLPELKDRMAEVTRVLYGDDPRPCFLP
ncbi:MAG: 5-(carboxyamino)imidazole ribonucleotide synthase [Thermoplasmata archaeon]|jgi:5-(carboxyamino)imidazole ribonucleotide synthase